MKQKNERSDIVKKALVILKNRASDSYAASPRAERADIVTSLLIEVESDQASEIIVLWKRLFGLELDREQMTRHLAQLRAWQGRRTK